jgi:acetylcholinesterase
MDRRGLPAQKLVAQGQYSKVPMVTGDMDDEGTLFSLTTANITTEQQFRTYISENYAPRATQAEISELAAFYPQDPTQGSPFDTGYLNQLTRTFTLNSAFSPI